MALEQNDDVMNFCDNCVYKTCTLIPPTKKLRTKKLRVSGADRISDLPDDIISNILSRLPTKHAVRTCVLSQCWKNNWTSIHSLCVDYHCQSLIKSIDEVPAFYSFVNKVLDLTRNSRLKNFHLSCNRYIDGHQISTWISAVLNRGVQNVIISGNSSNCIVCLDQDCATLEELKLSLWECTLEILDNNCFSKLKHLYLKATDLGFQILSGQPHETTGQLLLNFPVLQVLKLENFRVSNIKSVEIRAPELIIFSARYSWVSPLDDNVIKIRGPKLQKIYSRHGYINIDFYAPVVHYIDLHHECVKSDVIAPQVHAILQGAPGLTCLKLNRFVVQALMLRKEDLSRFDQLKRLEVGYCGARPLLELLHTMENLEYLNIVFPYRVSFKHEERKPLPLCIVPRLKEVRFMEFRGVRSQVDLVKLFLKDAKKLEKVFVFHADNYVTKSVIICRLTALASKTSARLTFHNRPSKGDFF